MIEVEEPCKGPVELAGAAGMNETGKAPLFASLAPVDDALYCNRDYEGECDFLEEVFARWGREPIHSLLDLGCGSGDHAHILARRGFTVEGVDRSWPMLVQARRRARAAGGGRLRFRLGDVRWLHLGRTFDAALCLLAVLGDQTTDDDALATLRAARAHLGMGGLFVCDFWYGPAVARQPPSALAEVIESADERIVRHTDPRLDARSGVVTVLSRLLRMRGAELLGEIHESRRVRFFFRPEIERLLGMAHLQMLQLCELAHLDRPATDRTWNVSLVARAI